ncbi:MAG: SDR family oxidoreductase [Candidatus Poseidoniaceae archaeon]|jgi:pteridine reductase|nr:SDR family oxidoreductase [Candidatus Poseidoniaceae archaeon]
MPLAVITGGARRIGAAITSHLLDQGWIVILHCNNSVVQAKQLLQKGRGGLVKGDLSNDDDLFRIIEEIDGHKLVESEGGIDLLIHNASIYKQEDFSTITPQELRRFSRIHLDAPFFITQGLSPKLKKKKGCVIGIVDTSWNHAWKDLSHYTATKGSLRQLIVNLAGELAPEIRVNGIAPGAIIAASWEKERFNEIVRKVPLGRPGDPLDIAKAIEFLYNADYITGYILPVDGGWSLT